MKNFLVKEIKLCLSAVNYLFLFFVAMIIIPNYPCYVPFFYLCLSIFFVFNNAELNKDIQYSMILPITKKDMVKSRCILVCVYEIAGALFTIPFAIIIKKFVPQGNQAGIDANVAFYGLILIVLTVFNFVFFTSFYKKSDKPGRAFMKSSIFFWVLYIFAEFPIWTKNVFNTRFFIFLDSIDFASQIRQLPILIAGILIFVIGWILTYKRSAALFEKVDL